MGHRRSWAFAAVVLLQVLVLGSFLVVGSSDTPHDAPVAVVADPVIVAEVVDQAADLVDDSLDFRAAGSASQARAGVADGRLVAAVVVDLRVEQDTLLLASANGDDLNRAVLRLTRTIESSVGRDVEVEDVVPSRAGDDGGRGLYLLVGVCVVLGFVAPVAITWLRGPVAPTLARGVARIAIVAGSAAAGGLAVAIVAASRYDTGLAGWWLIAGLTLAACATTTLALESLFGAPGIGVATAVLVLSAAPMARSTSTTMLAGPWSTITPWLPHGAALDAARAHAYFGGADPRPLLVLAAWSVLAVLTLVVSRRERDADAVRAASSIAV